MTAKYGTLAGLKAAVDAGEHPKLVVMVDNDSVVATEAVYDAHGDWVGPKGFDCLYEEDDTRSTLHAAFKLLGMPSEDV